MSGYTMRAAGLHEPCEMSYEKRKEIADNLSDSLFFAADDVRDALILLIEKRDEKLAEMIKQNIIFR